MWVKNNLIFVWNTNLGKVVHENGVAEKHSKKNVVGCLTMNKQSCEYGTTGILNMSCGYMLEVLILECLTCLKNFPEFKNVMTLLSPGVFVTKLKWHLHALMKTAIFWDVTICCLIVGTNVLDKPDAFTFRIESTLLPWRKKQHIPPKLWYPCT